MDPANIPDIGLFSLLSLCLGVVALFVANNIGQALQRKANRERYGYPCLAALEDHIEWLDHQLRDTYWNDPQQIEAYKQERTRLQERLETEQARQGN
tara:strand:+ start:135230 stop:135520 length:291 start_codon:yes stop_codon:yes gene_type:complete